jgi:hypothetical protein
MLKKLFLSALMAMVLFSCAYAEDDSSFTIFQINLISPVSLPPMVDNVYGLRTNVLYGSSRNVCGMDIGLAGGCSESMLGLQASVFGNWAGTAGGIQIAGLVNGADNIRALQVAPIMNYSRTISPFSLQVSLLNLSENNGGFQSGLVNLSDVVHWDDWGSGWQIGAWNNARVNNGLQIGVINITDDLKGFQLGLINISRDRFTLLFNWSPFINPVINN